MPGADPSGGSERAPLLSLLPAGALLLALAVPYLAGGVEGHAPWRSDTWVRWDSHHYIGIASHGFTFEPCARIDLLDPSSVFEGIGVALGLEEGSEWCGNAGWFPGYPALIRIVAATGVPHAAAGVTISVLSYGAFLWLLWRWFLSEKRLAPAATALLCAAFFLGHIYFHAVFPVATTALAIVVHMKALREGWWWTAGVAGATAALLYPTAFLLAPVALMWRAQERRKDPWTIRLAPSLLVGAWVTAGYGAVMMAEKIETGSWVAFFEVQSRFNYGVHLPTTRLGRVAEGLVDGGMALEAIPHLHSIVAAVLVIGACTWAAGRWRELEPIQRWATIYIGTFWVFPLMLNGEASLYRIESLLFPGVILLPRVPPAARWATAATLVALSYPMALLFFRGTLI